MNCLLPNVLCAMIQHRWRYTKKVAYIVWSCFVLKASIWDRLVKLFSRILVLTTLIHTNARFVLYTNDVCLSADVARVLLGCMLISWCCTVSVGKALFKWRDCLHRRILSIWYSSNSPVLFIWSGVITFDVSQSEGRNGLLNWTDGTDAPCIMVVTCRKLQVPVYSLIA